MYFPFIYLRHCWYCRQVRDARPCSKASLRQPSTRPWDLRRHHSRRSSNSKRGYKETRRVFKVSITFQIDDFDLLLEVISSSLVEKKNNNKNDSVRTSCCSCRSLLEAGGVDRLMTITHQRQRFSQRVVKFASQVLYSMWSHQVLISIYRLLNFWKLQLRKKDETPWSSISGQ